MYVHLVREELPDRALSIHRYRNEPLLKSRWKNDGQAFGEGGEKNVKKINKKKKNA
jgi:hypothetical protein